MREQTIKFNDFMNGNYTNELESNNFTEAKIRLFYLIGGALIIFVIPQIGSFPLGGL